MKAKHWSVTLLVCGLVLGSAAAAEPLAAHPPVDIGREPFVPSWVTGYGDGALWLLEWSGSNRPRLRRIAASGDEAVFGPPADF